ncbi:hypothetical protein BLNAU_23071 [Blattamonas nauphoetae]|uniref:Uncharacterized protein n=1 Tax=Blattamonas nauphoetae TaxID=2049346 RepID=A0ABQ9WR77_9EUKA|nr:hypothetical protein BLNAU_23071 [Blattamonas nauphoetae]
MVRFFSSILLLKPNQTSEWRISNTTISSTESIVSSSCECPEWLNIPTGFGSALAHSNTDMFFDFFEDQDRSRLSPNESLKTAHLNTTILGFLSQDVNTTRDCIRIAASWIRDLTPAYAQSIVIDAESLPELGKLIISPIPAEMSVLLEFVKRLVSVGSVEIVMEMVHYGMLDVVIGAVSESSRNSTSLFIPLADDLETYDTLSPYSSPKPTPTALDGRTRFLFSPFNGISASE